MNHFLTAEHYALIDEVRDFATKHFDFPSVAQWVRDGGITDEVVKAFVQLDFNGFGVIHRRGHTHYDMLAQVLVLEELARVAGATLPFHIDFLHLQILERFAGLQRVDEIRTQYHDTGRLSFALAVSEPDGGSDTAGMKTRVRTEGGRLVMRGQKMFVNNGEFAPYLLIAALDGDVQSAEGKPAFSFWMLPRDLPGISVYPEAKIGQRMLPFANIVLDDVEVKEEYRLGNVEFGFGRLYQLLEIGRVFVCATALGEAQAAMEDAVEWARLREAFGERVSDFQQIQQMLTDMEVRLTNMRNLVYQAAWEYDNASHDRLTVALMKRYVPAAATQVASDAMQILGGRGYTREKRVAAIWQDCRGFQIAEGTDQVMVRIASPLIMRKYDRPAEAQD